MNKKIIGIIALMLIVMMAFSSCNFFKKIFNKEDTTKVTLNDAALNAEKIIDFANGANPDVLFESDGWTNGDVFNVVWKASNVKYENGLMKLGITEEKATAWVGDAAVEYNYTAGEARTQNYYHYGDFEVSMKPSANPGTASTFFTCTGPYDTKFVLDANGDYVLDENGQRVTVENPHDEIDIEFLGKDTTHVQFNFFVNGVGGNEYMHELGFDASQGFHTYGYRWEPNAITWFVDGVAVYKVTTDTSVTPAANLKIVPAIPSTPGRILTNYWCGNERAEGWMGKYNGAVKDQGTEYQWIATSATGAPLNPPEKPNTDITGIDWTAIAPIAPTFASTEKYTVTNTENSSNITYTEVGGSSYINVEMDITEAAALKNYVHLVVTNNGTADVRLRVNVVDMALVEAGAQNMSTNQSATMDGEVAFTDLEWGGSFFDLAAGQTAELVIAFTGAVERLQLMPDSSRNNGETYAGDITVTDIKFTAVGEIELPCEHTDADEDGKCDSCGADLIVPPSLEPPTSGDVTTTVNGEEITFQGNVTDGYGVNANDEDGTVNVVYNAMTGNSYKNIWATVTSIASTKNIFSVTITNNGEAAVKVRIDLECDAAINANHAVCNLSGTQDGAGVYTDLEWGGTTFTIEAGATAVCEVTYDASKAPKRVKIFVDSSTYDDSAVHEGDITLSAMEFKGEYTPDDNPPAPTPEFEGLWVEFKTTNPEYTVDTLGAERAPWVNTVKITWADLNPSWQNVNVWLEDKWAEHTVLEFKITNNGATDIHVFTKIESAEAAELGTDSKTVAPGATETVTINFAGGAKMIYFFIDSTNMAAAGPNSGDITISEIQLGKLPAAEEEPEYAALSYTGNECYTITPAGEATASVNVTFAEVSTDTYQNVNASVAAVAAGKSAATLKITNNGADTIKITVKLEDAAATGLTEQTVEIAAGASADVSLTFSGEAASLFFFIGTGWNDGQNIPSTNGDVTISNILFA